MTVVDAIDQDTGEVVTIDHDGPRLPVVVKKTRVSIEIPEGTSFEDWSAIGDALKSVEGSIMWWVGDWACFGQRYGEKYSEVIAATGYDYSTIAHAKSVADRIKFCRRRQNLAWAHHQEIAGLPEEEGDELLDWCEEPLRRGEKKPRPVRELHSEVSRRKAARKVGALQGSGEDETCTVADLWRLAEQIRNGERPPYGTVYADPPWLYHNQATRAATGNHYSGMTVEELCELPISALAAPDAHLHLWTTSGFLFECPKIIEAWGFEYKSFLIWRKPQMGLGNYWRKSCEVMLTAVRGDACRFNDHSLTDFIECDRGPHSEKPEETRARIVRASPGPYLELFGRKPVTNWAVWGNQLAPANLFTLGAKEIV